MDQAVIFPVPAAQVQRVDEDLLIARFRSACMEGAVRFRPGEAVEVPIKSLPKHLTAWWKGSAGRAQVFRLSATQPAYLVVVKPDAASRVGPTCSMAMANTRLNRVWDKLSGVTYADDARTRAAARSFAAARMPRPDQGYELSGREVGYGYTIVQIDILSEKQKAKMQAEQARVARLAAGQTK